MNASVVMTASTLYTPDLLNRMERDPQLGRFWHHRSTDGVKWERQLIVDFLVAKLSPCTTRAVT